MIHALVFYLRILILVMHYSETQQCIILSPNQSVFLAFFQHLLKIATDHDDKDSTMGL